MHDLIIQVNPLTPADEIQCHRLVFNRYMLSDVGNGKDLSDDKFFDFVTGDIITRENVGKVVCFRENRPCRYTYYLCLECPRHSCRVASRDRTV
jgi:hypothetical protein